MGKIIIDLPNKEMNKIVKKKIEKEWNPWEKIDIMIQEEMESEKEFCERLQDELL